ncbi:MAG: alpha-ketoglutarate-dependent dioxygenase AlkB [Chloroflexi bacterium]|nr:alpha-ketoglutarate-dependent dioxygenase AlkB [Chloroflexota bacterium]
MGNTDIAGLSLLEAYISEEEETALVMAIDSATWRNDLKRRVQHYGYRYDYRTRSLGPDHYLGPLPRWSSDLVDGLIADGIFARPPDQLIVNEYLPGQGIASHIDCLSCFGNTIVSLSLLSGCIMRFSQGSTGLAIERWLPRRSLLIMQGPARFEWRHSIAARKTDRVDGRLRLRERRLSLTFRTVRIAA